MRDYGLNYVEVSDNGSGINSANYGKIAKRYYTSKISKFEDL